MINVNNKPKEPSEAIKELADYAIDILKKGESLSQIEKDMKKIKRIKKKYKLPNLWYSIEENSDNEDTANDPTLSFAIFITVQEPQSVEYTDIIVNSVHYVTAAHGEYALSDRYDHDIIFDEKTGNIINPIDLGYFNDMSDALENMCFAMILSNKTNYIEVNSDYISSALENTIRIQADIEDVIVLAEWAEEDVGLFSIFYKFDMSGKEFYGRRDITNFYINDKGERFTIKEQVEKELELLREKEDK